MFSSSLRNYRHIQRQTLHYTASAAGRSAEVSLVCWAHHGFFRAFCIYTQSMFRGSMLLQIQVCFQVSALVIAEQVEGRLGGEASCTISAARCLGGPITVLLAGQNVDEPAKQASALAGVSQVLPHVA